MGEAPASQTLGWLPEGKSDAVTRGAGKQCGGITGNATGAEPGPNRAVFTAKQQQATIDLASDTPDRVVSARARSDYAEMEDVKVVSKQSGVYLLAGQKAFDQFSPTMLACRRTSLTLECVLLTNCGGEVVEHRGLGREKGFDAIGSRVHLDGLLEDEVAEQGESGHVAAQDDVEANAVASSEASLGQQYDRDGSRRAVSPFERLEAVLDGGRHGGPQTYDIGRVACLRRIGDRVDASHHRLFELIATSPQTLDERGVQTGGIGGPGGHRRTRPRPQQAPLEPLVARPTARQRPARSHPPHVTKARINAWVL